MTSVLTGGLVGAWALEERIGGGGQATVYRARHATLGRPAAVKLFHRSVWADRAFRVRFRRECDALLALRHPHIVPIHDAGEQDGRGYIVMSLARGGSLAERIAGGPLAADEAVEVLRAAAGALDAAHAAGLLHRDVTPANLLLDPDGPWLADFGIARRADATALTGEGLLVGTAGFLAPEVIGGAPAGATADRYALAAVAFEALVGRPPFEADGAPALLYAHLRRTPPRASSLRPDLPRALDAALARGLAKDPRDRPATAAALVGEIERALGPRRPGITRLLTRPTAIIRRGGGRRRSAAPAALLAAGLLMAGGAAAGLTAATIGDAGAARGLVAAPEPAPSLTVPGPDGAPLAALAAQPADLPGLGGTEGAASADVAGVRVTSLPGGWRELAVARAALGGGLRSEVLVVDGRRVAELLSYYLDIAGNQPRWALMALRGRQGPRAVLVRGVGDAPARYASSLAASLGPAVVAAP